MNETKKNIYLVLSFSGTWFSRIIRRISYTPYPHVSIALDKEIKEMYSFGRHRPRNPLIAGFQVESQKSGFYKIYKKTYCLIYELEITQNQFDKLRGVLYEFIDEKEKYSYSILGLFWLRLGMYKPRQNKFFCTGFVAEVLKRSGIRLIRKRPCFTTPDDYYNLDLPIIYEGKFIDYGNNDK